MQKTIYNDNSPKTRFVIKVTAKPSCTKSKNILYVQGKKITDKVLHILNYQYKDSDLEQFVF